MHHVLAPHLLAALLLLGIVTPSHALAQAFLPAVGHQDEVLKGLVKHAWPTRAPLRVVVISDLNSSYGSTHYHKEVHDAIAWITSLPTPPHLVLSTGDHVAGMKPGLDYQGMWQSFHHTVTAPLTQAHIPFAPTPGNHDATSHKGYEQERQEYARQWTRWRPALSYVDTAHFPMRYAFVMKGVLFVSLDATTTGKLSPNQTTWLDKVLSNHTHVLAKIVFGHMPLHPVAQGREGEIMDDPTLEALLVRHKVSAYLSGHHHAYYPGRRGALRLVHLSCLGGGPRALQGADGRSSKKGLVVLEIDPHSGTLSVQGREGAQFEHVVPRTSLPERIGQGRHEVVRDDL